MRLLGSFNIRRFFKIIMLLKEELSNKIQKLNELKIKKILCFENLHIFV